MKGLRAFREERSLSAEVERSEGMCKEAGTGHLRAEGAGRRPSSKATLSCLCSPEPRCAFYLAANLGLTQTQWHYIGAWHMGHKPFKLLTDALAGCLESAQGCLVDLRLQEGSQCT